MPSEDQCGDLNLKVNSDPWLTRTFGLMEPQPCDCPG